MSQEERKTMTGDPVMSNVASKLRSSRQKTPCVPEVMFDFADYIADIVEAEWNRDFIPETMVILLWEQMDYLRGKEVLKTVEFPEKLASQKTEILENMRLFPLIIDKIASKEFAEKFRYLFGFTGLPQKE